MTATQHANDNRPAWFDALLLKYDRLIRGESRKRAGVIPAEDLYQEYMVRLLTCWRQYRPGSGAGFVTWVRLTTRSVVRDSLIKNRPDVSFEDSPPDLAVPATQEHAVDLAKSLRWCSPIELDALVLTADGYTGNEAGAALGISREAVRLRLNSGRAKILRAANDNKRVRVVEHGNAKKAA